MEKNYEKCTSFHQMVGVYEALADMSVAYLKNGNDVMRKWYAEYLQQRLDQLKQDYNTITSTKKASYDKV